MLYIFYVVFVVVWMIVTIAYDLKHPFTIEDLTVEERIRYEQMIFP